MLATQERLSKAAPILACLAFAGYTQHAREDHLITFRASLNLATGNGLVYQPGERVHSFTSPLGTLLPALFALGGGSAVEIKVLWWFRLVSAAASGLALWLVIRLFFRDRLAPWAAAVACGLWVFDPKIVDFYINGMESALLIFFVVLIRWALVNQAKIWPVALSFAGLQWSRPDGVVFFGALSLAGLCLSVRSASTRARLDAIQFLPGRRDLDFGARFLVYARNAANASHGTR